MERDQDQKRAPVSEDLRQVDIEQMEAYQQREDDRYDHPRD